jgi:hypothetical protein
MISWQSQLPSKRRRGDRSMSVFLCVVAGIGLLSSWSEALTDNQHLSRKTEPGTAIAIKGHARIGDNCQGAELPTLQLEKAPDHGNVCFRVGEIKIAEIYSGNTKCLGVQVRGARVIYVPRYGYVGTDTLRYSSVAAGENLTFDFDITIANPPGAPDIAPSDANAPPKEGPQSAGPMPACTT